MEAEHSFRDIFLVPHSLVFPRKPVFDFLRLQDGDDSLLYYAAKALMRLQQMFGHIPNIKGRGVHAQAVANMLLKFTEEVPT